MKHILVLHDEKNVRERLCNVLVAHGYQVVVCASLKEFRKLDKSNFELYICGQLGKYSDGLIFALDLHDSGKKVVIVGKKRKFSRLPFMDIHGMTDLQIKTAVEQHVAGGN